MKMTIRRRMTFTVLSVGVVALLLLSAVLLHAMLGIREIAVESGQAIGEKAFADTAKAIKERGRFELMNLVLDAAGDLDRELRREPGVSGSEWGGSYPASLQTIMDEIKLHEAGRCFVLDGQGRVIILSEKPKAKAASEIALGKDLYGSDNAELAQLAREMAAGREGVAELTVSGRGFYMAYAPIKATGWSIAVAVEPAEMQGPVLQNQKNLLKMTEEKVSGMDSYIRRILWLVPAIVLAFAAVVIYAGARLSERFVQPIQLLNSGVREIAGGNLDKKLAIRTGDELQELADSVNFMTAELKEYMQDLAKATADKERIATELSLAAGIQQSMLPPLTEPFCKNSHFELSAMMDTAKEVGGDFYDFYLVDEDHLAVTIADVSGKGVPAALFMAISKMVLKNSVLAAADSYGEGSAPDLAAVVGEMNRTLCENNEENMFVTVFLGVLDLATGELAFVNGAHNPPLLHRRAEAAVQYLRSPERSCMIGVFEDEEYYEHKLVLAPGDMLFLYTDGVTEASNEKGGFYLEERLQQVFARVAGGSAAEVLEAVREDLRQFVGQSEQSDDITMLGLRFLGRAEA